MRNGGNDLELITWESTGSQLLRKGSATAGPIDNASVATVALTPNLVVTGYINSGNLELLPWSVSSTGAVTPGSPVLGAPASSLRMTKLNSSAVLVAVVDSAGGLTIYNYAVADGGIGWAGQISGAGATIVSVAALSSKQLVTAIRTTAGDLQIDSWGLNADNAFHHEGTNSAGNINSLDITAHPGGVATAVSNAATYLEVIDWTVNPTTGAIARKSSFTTEDPCSSVAASTIGNLIFTAVRNQSANVSARVWGYNGTQLMAGAFAQKEAAWLVGGAAPLSTGLYSVTASSTSAVDLQLDVWSGDYVAP